MPGGHADRPRGYDVDLCVVDQQAAVETGTGTLGGNPEDPWIGLRDADTRAVYDEVCDSVKALTGEIRLQPRGRIGDQNNRRGWPGVGQ